MKKAITALLALSVVCTSFIYSVSGNGQHNSAVCSAATENMVMTANPVISRDVPAYSGKADGTAGNDKHYFTFWQSSPEDYLAYDLSGVPEDQRSKVIAVWYNTSSYDNVGQYVSRSAEPEDYVIEVNAAEGGSYPSDGWETVKTVSGNGLCSRQTVIDMKGYNWIRLRITKSLGDRVSLNFDIHDVSAGVSDSWLFLGDSITAGSMMNCYGTGYAEFVTRLDSRFFPVQENGGIGGTTSTDGKEHIEKWLSDNSARFVSIAYGTNDAWGNQSGAERYYNNTKYMIDTVLEAGKIPVLPKIPYSTNKDVGDNLEQYNSMIDRLYEEYSGSIVKGPDFYSFFSEHPDLLSGDGVHPSSEGYEEMRKTWAETMYESVYSSVQDVTPPSDGVKGDVNGDGSVTSADITFMMKYLVGADSSISDRADLSSDGRINVVDLIMLKNLLISSES